jgi:uncharacterized protein YfaS (alpha-2-macroglobulin family)
MSARGPAVSLYGGVFTPEQPVRLGYYGASGPVTFRLERLLEPEMVLTGMANPHRPVVPSGARARLVRTIVRSRSARGYGDLDLGRLPSGVYALRARDAGGEAGTLVIVSDLGLVVKRGPEGLLSYTASRSSGRTLPAKVWVREMKETTSLYADTDGLARQRVRGTAQLVVLARHGEEWALSDAYWNGWAMPATRGYVYTDRPIYRPGQHVDVKGTVRGGQDIEPLTGRAIRVIVRAPDDREVFAASLSTNSFGSFSGGFDLPPSAGLGSYRIVVRLAGPAPGPAEEFGGDFIVQEYVKPEYSVTVSTARQRAVQGDRASVTISAQYLFGGAVGGARVTYSVTRAPHYPFLDDEEAYFGPDSSFTPYGSDLVIREEARLDQNGRLELNLPLLRDQSGRAAEYVVRAEVEDESRNVVSGSARLVAFPAAVSIGLTTDSYVYQPNQRITARVEAANLDGQPASVPVAVDLVRQEWRRDSRRQWQLRERVVTTRRVQTARDGRASLALSAPSGGGYLLRARAADPAGRVARAESFAWVVRKGEDWFWNYREIEIRLDRRQYAPGDTATALIGSPHPGAPILVTVEGGGIRRAEVLRSTGAAVPYSLKVTADMSPNVFVTATVLADGNVYTREARVRVPANDKMLAVNAAFDKPRYKPGESGKMRVTVRDAAGKGVAAELGLGVVDEAIYIVQPDRTPDIRAFFHGPRENVVGTSTGLGFYFESLTALAPPRAPLNRAVFAAPKEAALAPGEVREDFRDTILWLPHLVTGPDGTAEVNVTFPDNLTTWRATTRAISRGAQVGQTTGSTITTKDLIARPSLPAFLVRGDTATISSVVNSNLSAAASGSATLSFDGLRALGPTASVLVLPPKGRARQDVSVAASTPGSATITASVNAGGASDAVRLPLQVLPRGFEETLGWAAGTGEGPRAFTVPPDVVPGSTSLRVDITPSLVAAVSPALEYLIGFPYGCTEQTMSRFLPAVLARAALGSRALPLEVIGELPAIIEAGLARLAAYQHEDGGWGFWENDDSSLEMTAYVLHGLVRAKALGAGTGGADLDRAVRWLSAHAVDQKSGPQGARAHAYRVLADAGRPDREGTVALARRSELSPYSLANLALALERSGESLQARDLLDRLVTRRQQSERGVHWSGGKRGKWFLYWEDNDVQVTAVALEALARLAPDSPLVPRVSAWLLANRQGPQWVSTQDTAAVVSAALALPNAAVPAGATAQVLLNGQTSGDATPIAAGSGTLTLTPDPSRIRAGRNTLEVRLEGGGDLTYSAGLTYQREPAELRANSDQGLSITRRYDRLEPKWLETEQRYVYERRSLLANGRLQPVTVGDLILVTLVVHTDSPARYLAVSDPIPAGTRAADERPLAINGVGDGEWEGDWSYWYGGREMRDRSVDLFATFLNGSGVMRYVLRARTPGTFTALPTTAFLMYDPDVRARAAAATLTIRDRGQ